ncbi:hypothetical protein SDC9_124406 [bioreactor metagenome]|uniref:Uncharacterized protein n=1 Tax=bioreactor metagenome TaxID=1076179 RepID=A0A645CKF0_9ZZZZ
MTVIPPSIDCVLGDKLTAFAPHTTGVPLGKEKDSEVIKQFYDVSTLIDAFENFDDVRKTYFSVCRTELGYRGSSTTPEEALRDTLRAAICIGSRGKTSAGDFSYYNKGTREITNHIYKRGFSKHLTLVELFCHCVTTSQTHEKYLTTIAKRKTIKAFSVKAKYKG